jgi:hypothetical protein
MIIDIDLLLVYGATYKRIVKAFEKVIPEAAFCCI